VTDSTLEVAGPMGRALADGLTEKVTDTIDKFPDSSTTQRNAIAIIIANNLYDWAEQEDGD